MSDDTFNMLQDAFQSFIDDHAAGQGFSEDTEELFNQWLTRKGAELVYEDHEKYMTSSQMASHLRKLFKMCEDETAEKKFLKKLGEAAGKENCTEKDIKECATKLCNKDKEECDKLIHALEDHVGYKKDLSDKEKIDEAWEAKKSVRGKVAVHKETGRKGVVLAIDDGNINVAPVRGKKVSFRSPTMWRRGEYSLTDERINVPDYAPGGSKAAPQKDDSGED